MPKPRLTAFPPLKIHRPLAPFSLARTFKTTTPPQATISSAVKADHGEIKDCYANFLEALSFDDKKQWATRLAWELARHSAGERLVLYPVFEDYYGAEGKAIAERGRSYYKMYKDHLRTLETTNVSNSSFRPTFDELMASLLERMEEKEQRDLPLLEAIRVEPAMSHSLAQSFQQTKSVLTPSGKLPFETPSALIDAPIDTLLGIFQKIRSRAA
ncbi:hypothetical protein BOTBODRAFT_39190 [Botryobasidium botryosum FD-172 SS1]|uniref:Hemerythrin-like domain-containing protein n=1 Tax=Botryobasidium botryosum (strain FD-172 SS1) TaxID=930990 RepID=A0A067LUG5_BOTB1|nr:hypothetical protein BOTBODRAFT_39190 [Botryobasidium botryosum FD-172 SS1]